MLPYRTDVAIVPVVQYPPGQPPAMPSIVPNPLVAPYLAEITSAIVNELGLKAYSNATRLFAYNALSDNNWRNQRMDRLVEFVCDTIAQNLTDGKIASPQQGLHDTVAQCVTMTVSSMIFEFPDLKVNLPPAVLDAAIQNVQVMNDLQTKSNVNKGMNMYPQQQMPVPAQMQPGQQPMVYVDQFGRPYTYDQQGRAVYVQPPAPQGYPQQMPVQPMGYPQQMPMQPMGYQQPIQQASGRWSQAQPGTQSFGTPANVGVAQPQQPQVYDRYARQQSTQQPVAPQQIPAPVEPVKDLTKDDWRPSEEQYYRISFDPTRYRAVYRRTPSGNVVEEIEKIMDRDKHRTVLGGVKLPTNIEEEAIEEAVAAIERRSAYKSVPVPTKEALMVTNFLDEAINDGNVERLDCKLTTYRVVAQVCSPVVLVEDVAEYLAAFSTCADLTTLCNRLKATASAFDQWNTLDEKLDYLLRIDNFLTQTVNNFLHNELSLDKLSIESFADDYLDLRRYLAKTYGDRYGMALQAFDKEAMSGLFQPIASDTRDTLESNVTGSSSASTFVSFVPYAVSITYTGLCSRDINVNEEQARMLQADSQPVLYNLAESLFVGKAGLLETIAPVYHYLVARDGARFKLHKGRLAQAHGTECYLVSKA